MRERRRRLSACFRVRGTFRARILTILSPTVIKTTNSAKNHISVYRVLIQSSDSLLQIIHFNIMQ